MDKTKRLFAAMFGIVTLLNVGYALLRCVRNTLAVADLGGGAGAIPIYEICGSMPGAILMTLGITWLLNRFPIQKVFLITITSFVGFFLFFVFGIYPSLNLWQITLSQVDWLPHNEKIALLVPQLASLLFFAMAELWKIGLLTVLFWGLINQYYPLEKAKKFYAPLMLGGSLGTFLAGPLITLCTKTFSRTWAGSLTSMMISLALISVVTVWLFFYVWQKFTGETSPQSHSRSENQPGLSVWESVQICFKSRYLFLLAWITMADYIAYALGELIFFDLLKQLYPDPRDYCNFQGTLTKASAILTAFSGIVFAPFLIRRCRWVVASLVTPVCLLVTLCAFFFALWHPTLGQNLKLLAFLGAALFCIVRAAKYTLFDTCKEISFILLPPLEKMQGKLVIDGMCSRFGRAGASVLSVGLIQVCGGVLASSIPAGILALGIAGSCTLATSRLGVLVEKLSPSKKSIDKAL